MSKRIAIVSGASSGMGQEFVKYIDKNIKSIDEIWIIARRYDRLEELKHEINKNCVIICEDVTDYQFPERFRKMLLQEKPEIKLLINGAGYGIYGKSFDSAYEIQAGMIQTNCEALTVITMLCIPYMINNSRIINMASSAAFIPQPNFSVYAATKSFVLSFSRSLNVELEDRGVYVTAVCPGPVNTEFFAIAENGNDKKPWFKELFMAEAVDVVNKAMEDAMAKKSVSIYGLSMNLLNIASKIVPHGLILKFYKG